MAPYILLDLTPVSLVGYSIVAHRSVTNVWLLHQEYVGVWHVSVHGACNTALVMCVCVCVRAWPRGIVFSPTYARSNLPESGLSSPRQHLLPELQDPGRDTGPCPPARLYNTTMNNKYSTDDILLAYVVLNRSSRAVGLEGRVAYYLYVQYCYY